MSGIPSVLLDRLVAARRAGHSFPDAWPAATAAAVAVADVEERGAWSEAFECTRPAWRSAFDREPAGRREQALTLVADGSDREPLPERECRHCGAEIPDGRGRRGGHARYCSSVCRRRAHAARAAA